MSDAHDTDLIDFTDLDDLDLASSADEERTCPDRACGDPAAHDRLLAMLRRFHPEGHDDVPETGRRPPRWQATRHDTSLVGCSAGLCADAA